MGGELKNRERMNIALPKAMAARLRAKDQPISRQIEEALDAYFGKAPAGFVYCVECPEQNEGYECEYMADALDLAAPLSQRGEVFISRCRFDGSERVVISNFSII